MNPRDALLFKTSITPYGNGIARFQNASLQTIEELIALNYLSSQARQSNSPTTEDYLTLARSLIKSYPALLSQIHFHGHVTDQSLQSTVLEGMAIDRGAQEITPDLKMLLKASFRGADELQFDNGEFFCWYD